MMHELDRYKYFGSDKHLEELDEWLVDSTHEDITPPWEE